jgi:hypothetical protein
MMRTTPQQFIDNIRSSSCFARGVQKDTIFVEHLNAVEYAITSIHALGDDDANWLTRYDEIRALLGREDMTVKERLLGLVKMMEPWQAERLRERGH